MANISFVTQKTVAFLTQKRIDFGSRTSKLDAYVRAIFAQTPSISNPETYYKEALKELAFHSSRKRPKPPIKPLKTAEVGKLEQDLIANCLTHVQDSYRVHLNRLQGLKILEKLVTKALIEDISEEMVVHMVWACLSCVHHFLLRLTVTKSITSWVRRNQAVKVLDLYEKMLVLLIDDHYDTILNAIITFFDEANLWDLEMFCSHLILKLLLVTMENKSVLVNEILDLVENSTLTNSMTACQIIRVLHDVEEGICWVLLDEELIDRFIDMYYKSVTPEKNKEYDYKPLEKGLETCLRSMSFHLNNDNLIIMIKNFLELATKEELVNEHLLNFGSLTEHVTAKYNKKIGSSPFPEIVFPLVIKLMASENLLYSLLGNRVLHNLTDRKHNRAHLDTPRLFYKTGSYKVQPNTYSSMDKKFFQRHRELLHSTIVAAIIKHGKHKVYLETIYVSIALFILEIPCGYTAAAGVCIAMAIQEKALENKKMELTHSHRLHATVISLLSLICYVHQADVFYDYVEKIVEKRATMAPHLNPPLRVAYKYAQHHFLWNKSEFFFEDWETRYGLWKCFRNIKTDNKVAGLF